MGHSSVGIRDVHVKSRSKGIATLKDAARRSRLPSKLRLPPSAESYHEIFERSWRAMCRSHCCGRSTYSVRTVAVEECPQWVRSTGNPTETLVWPCGAHPPIGHCPKGSCPSGNSSPLALPCLQ